MRLLMEQGRKHSSKDEDFVRYVKNLSLPIVGRYTFGTGNIKVVVILGVNQKRSDILDGKKSFPKNGEK